MNEHTPGPWEFEEYASLQEGNHAINEATKSGHWRAIATVYKGRTGGGSRAVQGFESIANGRLMAAAPELLDALETILNQTNLKGSGAPMEAKALAAIRKAKEGK